jgi:hypothetical protein
LPGCYTDGLTIEETRENMREAIQLHVEMLIENGDPVPVTNPYLLAFVPARRHAPNLKPAQRMEPSTASGSPERDRSP